MSDWKESDCKGKSMNETKKRLIALLTFRGTTNEIGSMTVPEILYARAISHSDTFSALRGRKHIPRCGEDDWYSESGCSVSDSYS